VHPTADDLSASEQGGPYARVRRDLKALQAGFFAQLDQQGGYLQRVQQGGCVLHRVA
jgi:hypothetical protein